MPERVFACPLKQLADFTVAVSIQFAHQAYIVSPGHKTGFLRKGFYFFKQCDDPFCALLVFSSSPLGEIGGVNRSFRMGR